jgi:hypothetical protein
LAGSALAFCRSLGLAGAVVWTAAVHHRQTVAGLLFSSAVALAAIDAASGLRLRGRRGADSGVEQAVIARDSDERLEVLPSRCVCPTADGGGNGQSQ